MDRPSAAVLHVDAERGWSGGEVQVFLLLEALAARGWRQALVVPPGSEAERRARERGIDVRAVPMSSDLDARAPLGIARAARGFGADLVHLHTGRATWLGGLGAALARVPAVTTRRMDREVARGPRTALVHRVLTRRTVSISPAVTACLLAGGVPEERIVEIPDAVDPARLAPRRARDVVRAELGARDDDVLAVALGSLVPRKGFDVLVEAAALAARPSLLVVIAGRGPEEERLARDARARGVRLALLGWRDDGPDLLAAADLAVLPSRREGLGVAALEAMAAGRALVASRVGGLGDAVVDGRSGLLVPPGDARALAAALARLVDDPALRATLGAGGRERIRERYLVEHAADAHERLYGEILAGVRRGTRDAGERGGAASRL